MDTAYEDRLTRLASAASHVVALEHVSRKLNRKEKLVKHIEAFGNFHVTLATMHEVVAEERCRMEDERSTIERSIINSTHVLVATVGTIFSKGAQR